MKIALDTIRHSLEGAIPGLLATCDAQGIPNVSYVSQVHYVDGEQVALSFQFFNKTRSNMLANPHMTAYVIDPETTARYRLALLYLRTETDGPLFQNMKAKLAGIASHTGMMGIFELRGADVCWVLDIERVPGQEGPRALPPCNWLTVLRSLGQRVAACGDMATLFEEVPDGLQERLDIRHALLLMWDEPGQKLYTVASRGYEHSGIGSEIPVGCGVIGVAAQYRTPIRISHSTVEYRYSKAMRDSAGLDEQLETAIPLPGLAEPHSQMALPLLAGDKLQGVLYVESDQEMRFGFEDEDGLSILAQQIALTMTQLQQAGDVAADAVTTATVTAPVGHRLQVRYFPVNQSIFLGDDYLIKGVAGAILWRLLHCYVQEGRTEFSNRELRLDRHLNLPDVDDNLEARLILLQRRLAEKAEALSIIKTGRGRFRLQVNRPVQLLGQKFGTAE